MTFSGVIAPSLTVFRDDEQIDEQATAAHIRWLIDEGVDGITPCGSSGELVALTTDETKRLIDVAMEASDGRVPVYPATGRYATRDTIELTRHAAKAGAQGVMIALPYYMLSDKGSILGHYRRVREAVDLPIILYNNPWTCGVELHTNEIAKLVEEGVIDAVKASQGDAFRVAELKYVCGDRVKALYGHDYAPLEAFFGGADGWLTGVINVFPRLAKALWMAAGVEKNAEKAASIWRRLMPYVYYSLYEKSPDGSPHLVVAYKEALSLLGRRVGKPRLPLQPMSLEQRERLAQVLELTRKESQHA